MLLDADVALLRDPFAAAGAAELGGYDVLYQAKAAADSDGGRDGGRCGGAGNAGVVLVRPTAAGRAFAGAMASAADRIAGGTDGLDQDLFPEAVNASAAAACTLPGRQFAGHCAWGRLPRSRLTELVAFHATCISDVGAKLAALRAVVAAARSGGDAAAAGGGGAGEEVFLEDVDVGSS